MSTHRQFAGALVAFGIAAAATAPASANGAHQPSVRVLQVVNTTTNSIFFKCPNDVPLTVEFNTADPTAPAIVRMVDGTQISLPAKESGSGFRYADDKRDLSGKGREVIWTDGSKPPVVCTQD